MQHKTQMEVEPWKWKCEAKTDCVSMFSFPLLSDSQVLHDFLISFHTWPFGFRRWLRLIESTLTHQETGCSRAIKGDILPWSCVTLLKISSQVAALLLLLLLSLLLLLLFLLLLLRWLPSELSASSLMCLITTSPLVKLPNSFYVESRSGPAENSRMLHSPVSN